MGGGGGEGEWGAITRSSKTKREEGPSDSRLGRGWSLERKGNFMADITSQNGLTRWQRFSVI